MVTLTALILLIVPAQITSAFDYIKTIHFLSHPYKRQFYYAERVKLPYAYQWCADYIHLEDAVVLCNQMSNHSGLGPYHVDTARVEFGALAYDPGPSEIFLNETFACTGSESRLRDCPTVWVGDNRCPSGNVGQVDCDPADNSRKNLTTSMQSMTHQVNVGVVEVESSTLKGMAGMICDEAGQWSQNEAKVACRSLGYSGTLAWPIDPADVPSDLSPLQRYVIKNVKCLGTEHALSDCPHTDMCMSLDFLDKTFRCPDQCSGKAAAVACG